MVEEHSTRVHLSYVNEAALLARERDEKRNRWVSALLTSDGRDAHLHTQVGNALGMDSTGYFLTAAAPIDAPCPLRQAVDQLRASAVPVHLQHVQGHQVLLAQLPTNTGRSAPQWLPSVPCGLAPLSTGLADVPRGIRISIAIAATLSGVEHGPRSLTDQWARLVANHLGELGTALCDEVLTTVPNRREHERTRLVETVLA